MAEALLAGDNAIRFDAGGRRCRPPHAKGFRTALRGPQQNADRPSDLPAGQLVTPKLDSICRALLLIPQNSLAGSEERKSRGSSSIGSCSYFGPPKSHDLHPQTPKQSISPIRARLHPERNTVPSVDEQRFMAYTCTLRAR